MKNLFKYKNLFLVILLVGFASCNSISLSEQERKIITHNLSDYLYKESFEEYSQPIYEYLWGCVDEFSDNEKIKVEKKIRERNALDAFLGGSWDVAELFGTTTNQLYINEYNKYINYVNSHNEDLYDLVFALINNISESPEILEIFNSVGWESESLEQFSGIRYMPRSISWDTFRDYENHEIDNENQLWWGKMVMGPLKHPSLSGTTVFYVVGKVLSQIEKPEAVYAVYDKEKKSWEIGYNTEQALEVKFTKKGDLINYEYMPCSYESAYINSKLNELNKPIKK